MIGALIAKRKARQQFAARARGDVDEFLKGFAEDAKFVFPGEPPWGGVHHGKEKIHKWFVRFNEQFPDAKFESTRIMVSNPIAITANNDVAVEWTAKLTPDSEQDRGVVIVSIQSGKAIHLVEYFFREPDQDRG